MPAAINPLYSILNNASKSKVPVVFSANKNIEGKPYLMIDLPLSYKRLCIDGELYHVDEQHISIFANFTEFSRNSLYHCSITLKNLQGKPYKLRAYFNEHDNLIDKLSFKTIVAAGQLETKIEISSRTEAMLSQFMHAQASPAIQKIINFKKQHTAVIKNNYISQVTALAEQTSQLKQNDIDGGKALLQKFDALTKPLATLKKIMPRFRDSKREQLRTKLDWQIADWSLAQSPKAKEVARVSSSSASPVKATKTKQAVTATKSPAAKTNKKAQSKPQTKSSEKEFQTLSSEYEALIQSQADRATSLKERTLQILAFLQKIKEFDLLLNFDAPVPEQKFRLKIDDMILAISNLINEQLNEAITKNNLVVVSTIVNSSESLPEELLKFALDNDDSSLIKLFFQKCSTPINHLSITNDDDHAQSLLLYTYQHNYSNAFKTLFKLGANPFICLDDGLPLLHHLISNPKGPFYSFTQQQLQLAGHQPYMTQLCILLEDYSEAHLLDDDEQIKIKGAIENYRIQLSMVLPVSKKEAAFIADAEAEISSSFFSKLSEDVQVELTTDPNLIQAKNNYLRAVSAAMSTLSKKEYRKSNLLGKDFFQSKAQEIEMAIQLLTKESLIIIFEKLSEKMPRSIELAQLNSTVKTKNTQNQIQQHNQRALQLQSEIEQLDQEIGHVITSIIQRNNTAITSTMDNLSTSLSDFEESLKSIPTVNGNPVLPELAGLADELRKLMGLAPSSPTPSGTADNPSSFFEPRPPAATAAPAPSGKAEEPTSLAICD